MREVVPKVCTVQHTAATTHPLLHLIPRQAGGRFRNPGQDGYDALRMSAPLSRTTSGKRRRS